MNNATREQHATMNAQLVLARQLLAEKYNATIDHRDVFTYRSQLCCAIRQKNIPNDGIKYLNRELNDRISGHPDSKIRNSSVLVEFTD